MKLRLIDLNPDVVAAWRVAFADHPEVEILQASILDVATTAVVSPANSHGFMDGGVDRVYLARFGPQLQDRVREMIHRRPEEMLPVGAAELVATRDPNIPWLIVAPTMETPGAVPAMNAGRAFAAVLRLANRHPELGEICCPGLCTGVGQVSPADSAEFMEGSYTNWKRAKQ